MRNSWSEKKNIVSGQYEFRASKIPKSDTPLFGYRENVESPFRYTGTEVLSMLSIMAQNYSRHQKMMAKRLIPHLEWWRRDSLRARNDGSTMVKNIEIHYTSRMTKKRYTPFYEWWHKDSLNTMNDGQWYSLMLSRRIFLKKYKIIKHLIIWLHNISGLNNPRPITNGKLGCPTKILIHIKKKRNQNRI
jgi:hypothetical protein